ncbi:MAG: prolyl oligopeptidase family serine peptidase [Chthoniobacteraceae bacterium]
MKLLLSLLFPAALLAQEVRPVPPPGIEVPAADRAEIEAGVKKLGAEIAKLREPGKTSPFIDRELPNVEIFLKSADWAIRYNEIFDTKQIAIAKDHILQGLDRAAALTKGEAPWNSASGLVVRGYRSKIDGSVQPYGLLLPETWGKAGAKPAPFPLHFWCHGRNEKLSELAFINGSQTKPGEFTPEGAIVCYLYGRYCNANKFAGETDLFEALEDIRQHYKIDTKRLVVRGFSMGGAACWQFAFHHPGMWAAAAPGAGFAETEEFFGRTLYAEGATPPPWWERHLWRWYDVTICARNVAGLPLVAYSGELDGQKQSADIMLRYAAQEKRAFTHIIGPDTPHKYHPDAKPVIEKFIDVALAKGRDEIPKSVSFTTYSLIYPTRAWVTILGMEKSWARADVDATIEKDTLTVKTKNVAALRLGPIHGDLPANPTPNLVIDGTKIPFNSVTVLRKTGGKWEQTDVKQLAAGKRPGLCGPVDHAFMSPFVFVRPTGHAFHDTTGTWVQSEMPHAVSAWRTVFRGDAPVKDDTSVTDDDIQKSNLVLWGDPSSNSVLRRMLPQLPFKWTQQTLAFRGYELNAATHMPILIFPNPLNPQRYVVLNSGPTFREFALLNNSDQTPKLPDWAIVDIRVPADAKWPGLIHDAGFFDEHWK